jgi:peptide/nickel transport system ATP-binding protein
MLEQRLAVRPVLEVDGLNVDLPVPRGTLAALTDVGLAVGRGETLALVGESGSGKTMTALAIMGLLPEGAQVSARRLALEGEDLAGKSQAELTALRGSRMAMVFQDPLTALNPVYRIGDQLTETWRYHGRGGGREATERAKEMLARVGIAAPAERMRQYPHQLSGGLRQRVVIAMALMCEPALLIADEPTTALDVTIQVQILALLNELRRSLDTALLLVTHDMGVVARMADRVAVMYAGRIVEEGAAADVFAAPRHPYTEALLRCIPDPTRRGRLGAVPGTVPSAIRRNDGCAFRPRCGVAAADCAVGEIPLTVAGGQAFRCRHPISAGAATLTPDAAQDPGADARHGGTILQARNLGRSFEVRRGWFGRPRRLAAVQAVSLDIRRGETLAIVGESGSGKTTLARLVLGLLAPTAGTIALDGKPLAAYSVAERARRLQPVFQDPYSSLNPRKTVGQIIGAPLKVLGGGDGATRRRLVAEMMARVGLPAALLHSYAGQLSGGQRQRIAIGRALVTRPSIVVCDEPTSALDVSVQAQILNLLADLRRDLGLTYLFISHDLAVVRAVADRVAVMYLGRIVEAGRADEVLDRPRHPYTRALLGAALTPDPRLGLPRLRLSGELPDPFHRPTGCSFHTRCPVAVDACRRLAPPLMSEGDRTIECHLPQDTAIERVTA